MRLKRIKIIVAGSQNDYIISNGYFISYFDKPNISLNDCQNKTRTIFFQNSSRAQKSGVFAF